MWGSPSRRVGISATRLSRVLLVGSLIIGVVAVGAEVAGADPYAYPNPGFWRDNDFHDYCYHSSVPSGSDRTRINESMSYLDDRTVITDDLDLSCGTDTDVMWIYQDDQFYGSTYCVTWANYIYKVCDAFWITINPGLHLTSTAACGDGYTEYNINMIMTVRHELGHSVGLSHLGSSGFSCTAAPAGSDAMTSDWLGYQSLNWTDYNNHHKAHIDCNCQNP